MPTHCPTECPAWKRPCGCGYQAVGAPCRHPRWRGEWEKVQAAQAARERQEQKPARARQLRMMEVG